MIAHYCLGQLYAHRSFLLSAEGTSRINMRVQRERQWLEENRAAIEAYNQRVAWDGILSDEAGLNPRG
jgi:Post-segregation antitoxin CcdA